MFHPVGSQPSTVYWRRRFLALAALVVLVLLLVLTVRAATSGASGTPQAGGAGHSPHAGAAAGSSHPPASPPTHATHTHAAATRRASSSAGRRRGATTRQSAMSDTAHRAHGSPTSATTSSSAPPPPQCRPADLQVKAYVAQTVYHVGDKPEVDLEVTDTGSGPCVQDLADPQVVLQIYNGESRVWGSHDCMVKPGTDDRVLAVGKPVFVGVTWSGFTSTPGCPAGSRQRVGAGTYTLYASLAGHEGAATQFSIV